MLLFVFIKLYCFMWLPKMLLVISFLSLNELSFHSFAYDVEFSKEFVLKAPPLYGILPSLNFLSQTIEVDLNVARHIFGDLLEPITSEYFEAKQLSDCHAGYVYSFSKTFAIDHRTFSFEPDNRNGYAVDRLMLMQNSVLHLTSLDISITPTEDNVMCHFNRRNITFGERQSLHQFHIIRDLDSNTPGAVFTRSPSWFSMSVDSRVRGFPAVRENDWVGIFRNTTLSSPFEYAVELSCLCFNCHYKLTETMGLIHIKGIGSIELLEGLSPLMFHPPVSSSAYLRISDSKANIELKENVLVECALFTPNALWYCNTITRFRANSTSTSHSVVISEIKKKDYLWITQWLAEIFGIDEAERMRRTLTGLHAQHSADERCSG
jgi:hypothetical protein